MGRTVDFNHERLDDIVSDHLEVRVSDPVGDLDEERRRRKGRKRKISSQPSLQKVSPISSLPRLLLSTEQRSNSRWSWIQ